MERKPRSYKIADKPYEKAKKKAHGQLATMIESWVTEYGNSKRKIIYMEDGSAYLFNDGSLNYYVPNKSKLKSSNKK